MAENFMARKDPSWQVIYLSPDVCKTPIGPLTPPVPYPVTANLGEAVLEVPNVRANGCPVVVLSQSFIPKTKGDKAGVAKGVSSGTVEDICEPMEHSSTVRVTGKPILRHGDKFWMNCRNTTGVIVGQPPVPNISAAETSSGVEPETEEEQSFLDGVKDWLRELAAENIAAMQDPMKGTIGAAKDAWNTVPEVLEGVAKAGIGQAAAEMETNARIFTVIGLDDQAQEQRNLSQELNDNGGINLDIIKFPLDGDAEKGGADILTEISLLIGLGELKALLKAAAKKSLAKTVEKKAAKNMDGGNVSGRADGDGKALTGEKVSDKKEGQDNFLCTAKGEPVDVATGDFLQDLQVIALPGTLPLTLNRLYRSRSTVSGLFGEKWVDNWSQQLVLDEKAIHFTAEDGLTLSYYAPSSQDDVDGINLHRAYCQLYGTRSGTLYLFNRQTQQTLCFDAQPGNCRRLSALRDRAGNQIRFHYQDEQLTALTHSDGYRVVLEWQQKQLMTVTRVDGDQQQWLVKCRYDDRGMLAECATFQYTHLHHEYNPHGHMIRWRDTDQTDVNVHYDSLGRVTKTQAEGGYYTDRFSYNDAQRCTTWLDSEGGISRYEYNVFGLVTRQTDALGRQTLTRWDRGNKTLETDALGRETRYRYNENGQVNRIRSVTGDVQYKYDEHGQVVKLTQPDGGIWRFAWNEQGRLLSQTDAQGRVQHFEYNEQGLRIGDIQPDGACWRYGWNEQHQLARLTAPDEATTTLTQDIFGRLNTVTNPQGHLTRYTHSQQHAGIHGSLLNIQLPDGITQRQRFDGEKRRASTTDGEGKTTHYHYGAFDLLLALTRPDGQTLHFGYDSLTRLNRVTNAGGDTWHLERDAAGQLIRETDFTGCSTTYQYDAVGRRILTRYADNRVVRLHWSARDELVREERWQEDAEQSVLLATTVYEYDAQGRMTLAHNADARVEFEYDAHGSLVCERINGREIHHEQDALSLRTVARRTDAQSLVYGYDITGRLQQMQAGEFSPLRLEHDNLGRERRRYSVAGFEQAQDYSPTGMLLAQTAGNAVNRRWTYDNAYNLRSLDDARWGTTHYQYNNNDQPVQAELRGIHPLLELFGYDENLNLNEQRVRERNDDVMPERISQMQQAGRVIRRGKSEYRYDSAGRLAERRTDNTGFRPQVWHYRWDAHSRMNGLVTPEGERWHYAYDAFGRRISKRCETVNCQNYTGYDYLWSGDQLIEETPVYADGTPAYDASIQWLYAPDALTPTARQEKGRLHYVVSDHMGTPRELLTEDGNVVWANRLNTWGRENLWRRPAANDGNVSCNLRFAGQYADEESGLHYNRHRYYDSETGQYLSSDPIGLAGGVNPYGYVHNPLRYIDPLGLACCKYNSRNEAFRAAKRDAGIPMNQQPSKVEMTNLTDRNGNNILGNDYKPLMTREYTFTRPGKEDIVIQDHSPGHIYGPDGTPGNQGPHINVRPKSDTRNGNVDGTLGHYPF